MTQFVRTLNTAASCLFGHQGRHARSAEAGFNAPTMAVVGRPLIGNGTNGTPGTGENGGDGGILFGNGGAGGSGIGNNAGGRGG